MSMHRIKLQGVLNSATSGSALADEVLRALGELNEVRVDVAGALRVTPSFANAFVMRVLAASPDAFRANKCIIEHASPHVAAAFEASRDRYARGIRLSDQLPHVA